MKRYAYKGLIVWKYLCRNPYKRTGEIAKALSDRSQRISDILAVLKRDGCVKRSPGHYGTWTATEYEPRDGRGLAAGSIAACARFGPLNLPAANRKLAELRAAGKIKPKRRRKGTSVFDGKPTLEQCWPVFRPSFVKADGRVNNRFKPAPQRALSVETLEDREEAA